MAKASLSALPRDVSGKGASRKLRASGRVPAVVYGHGEDTRSVTVDAHQFDLLRHHVHVESTIIDLTIEGEPAPVRALVRELQTHPVRNEVLHVDFYQIRAGEKLTVEVPIRLVGSAPGVKEGGLMQHTLVDLEVWCLPDSIPEAVEADVSGLDIGDSIHVSDLRLPEGVESLVDGDRTVCSVVPPTFIAEPEEEEADEEIGEPEEPEVIGREREEDEGSEEG
jgi:large subunit ribosomal protein L25